LAHRQLTAQGQRQGLEGGRETRAYPRPRAPSWMVLPRPPQATLGTSACNQASNWKECRWRHEQSSLPCSGREAARQAGQLSSALEQLASKSMRFDGASSLPSATTYGECIPNVPVNNASTPMLNSILPTAAPSTWGQAQRQLARLAHRARQRASITTVELHTKQRGV
jgi:hypothetical protein